MSACSGSTSYLTPTSNSLLEAIAGGHRSAAAQLISECGATGKWPLSPPACLFAAVMMRQAGAAVQLLDSGAAPPHFLVADLPPGDRAALAAGGVPTEGVEQLTPLAMAVAQKNITMARLLLLGGASTSTAGKKPLLLHFNDALLAGAEAAAEVVAAASGAFPTSCPPASWQQCAAGAPRPACSSITSTMITNSSLSVTTSSGCSSGSDSCGNTGASSGGGTPSGSGASPGLDGRLPLLWLLLCNGADPLEAQADSQRSFMTACWEPLLLRLAVNHVRQQCEAGRRLSESEAQHLVVAAGRAFLGGF